MTLLRAQFGNLQVFDADLGGLVILAQRNFRSALLDHFALVKPDDGSAGGRCLGDDNPVCVADVRTDPAFAPHRNVALDAGVMAVHSSPLHDANGRFIGVLSAHFNAPRDLSADEVAASARHAASVGEALGMRLGARGAGGPPACHGPSVFQ